MIAEIDIQFACQTFFDKARETRNNFYLVIVDEWRENSVAIQSFAEDGIFTCWHATSLLRQSFCNRRIKMMTTTALLYVMFLLFSRQSGWIGNQDDWFQISLDAKDKNRPVTETRRSHLQQRWSILMASLASSCSLKTWAVMTTYPAWTVKPLSNFDRAQAQSFQTKSCLLIWHIHRWWRSLMSVSTKFMFTSRTP